MGIQYLSTRTRLFLEHPNDSGNQLVKPVVWLVKDTDWTPPLLIGKSCINGTCSIANIILYYIILHYIILYYIYISLLGVICHIVHKRKGPGSLREMAISGSAGSAGSAALLGDGIEISAGSHLPTSQIQGERKKCRLQRRIWINRNRSNLAGKHRFDSSKWRPASSFCSSSIANSWMVFMLKTETEARQKDPLRAPQAQ